MTFEYLLSTVAEKLENCGISYMIVGSFASNLYGLARTTHDADIVIEVDSASIEKIEKLARAFGEEYYFDLETAKNAVEKISCAMRFIIKAGLK